MKVQKFMGEDFLLKNETAKKLYHNVAAKLPIIDYHCHLSAREIYENKAPCNLTELWLAHDHYKWRLMRANGACERYITGSAPDYYKFCAFAETLKYAIGNPIYNWSHLELQRYFNINTPLSGKTARQIWDRTSEKIGDGGFTPRELLIRSKVQTICTTDDPADDILWHEKLALDSSFGVKVLPSFRPEKAGEIWRGEIWRQYLKKLEYIAKVEILTFDDLKHALSLRMDAFSACGCVASDFGVEKMPFCRASAAEVEGIFKNALMGKKIEKASIEKYLTELMLWLAKEYAKRCWVMELHLGPIRARNSLKTESIGRDAGFDSISDYRVMGALGEFLNTLEVERALPRTVIFCMNENDSTAVAAMAANFQDDSFPSKLQLGAAWWMNDHVRGIQQQMMTFAEQGLIGRYIGMLTDSRSYLSYSRHEYFRRILCDMIGGWIENGMYTNDDGALRFLIERICYINVKEYFGL